MMRKITGNKNCILSYNFNIAPRNNKILLAPQKTEKLCLSENYQLAYLSGTGIEFNIVGITSLAACLNVDYFLAAHIVKAAYHKNHLVLWYGNLSDNRTKTGLFAVISTIKPVFTLLNYLKYTRKNVRAVLYPYC